MTLQDHHRDSLTSIYIAEAIVEKRQFTLLAYSNWHTTEAGMFHPCRCWLFTLMLAHR